MPHSAAGGGPSSSSSSSAAYCSAATPDADAGSTAARSLPAAERERQREIASYFAACSVNPNRTTPSTAKLSPDSTLIALAQLGALRLDCDRAFVSLIDGRRQYIITEVTRTHSLYEPNRCAPGDELFLGPHTLDVALGICPKAIGAFTDATGQTVLETPTMSATKERFVIRDFRADPTYADRTYVTGWPYFRSYVEVPLICPRGFVIGTYCVVDNKLRPDLEHDQSITIMIEVASTIMNHLDLMKIRENHSLTEKRLKVLGKFSEGNSSISAWAMKDGSQPAMSRSNSQRDYIGHMVKDAGARPTYQSRSGSSCGSADGVSPLDSATECSVGEECTPLTSPSESTVTEAGTFGQLHTLQDTQVIASPDDKPAAFTATSQESFLSASIRDVFTRASCLIRESIGVSGVVFLDASLSGSHLRKSPSPSPPAFEPGDPFQTLTAEGDGDGGAMCPRLGVSTSDSSDVTIDQLSDEQWTMSEALLQRMVQRYPRGYIFTADEYGPLLVEDDRRNSISGESSPRAKRSISGQSKRKQDIATMFEHFEGARSIIFLPLWDYQKERWYAATFMWSTDPSQSFEFVDLTYVSTFCNSIMAEITRFNALEISRAKSDFISSISHELRSPLHGILAGAELLREMLTPEGSMPSHDMLNIIVNCGNTLLDTMNQLLDFAKINSLAKPCSNIASSVPIPHSAHANAIGLISPTDLGALVQDVTESVYLGHFSTKTFHQGLSGDGKLPREFQSKSAQPLVLMNIENRPWEMDLDAGAWKRIGLNLIGNALKYTPSGHVKVSLRVIERKDPAGKAREEICFEVKDTGIGMGEEYMKHRLFTPFAQENSLSVGTGLGLSIVRQICRSIGGELMVRSQLGVGTCVRVIVPLPEAINSAQLSGSEAVKTEARSQLQGRTLCLTLPESTASANGTSGKQDELLKSSLSRLASDWFGMNVVSASGVDAVEADIYLTESSSMAKVLNKDMPMKGAPIVVLTSDITPNRIRKISGRILTLLRHPIGPRKFASVLLSALTLNAMPSRAPSPEPASKTPAVQDAQPLQPPEITTTAPTPTDELPPAPAQAPTVPPNGLQLLLVEDNAINLKILVTHVRKLKYEYATATNGQEAVDAYKRSPSPFHVIFMDVSMPVMDGFAATREIRAYERARQLPPCNIVALTGLGSAASQQEAAESGVDLFLTKPVPLKDLKELLAQYQERYHQGEKAS